MKTYMKNDLKNTYLILEAEELKPDDYQIMMLRENEIPGIIRTSVRYMDNQKFYYYDVGGKISLQSMYDKENFSGEEMRRLVEELIQVSKNVQKYMLDENCLMLEPELIFGDKEHFYFCYCPSCMQNVKEAFHNLTEFFIQKVNYKDEEGVHFAYTLHKATMEENYSIAEILNRFNTSPLEYSKELEVADMETISESSTFFQKAKSFFNKVKLLYLEDEDEDL